MSANAGTSSFFIKTPVPSYEETGPFGAKSVSEIYINGPAPVFNNALYNATGARLNEFPFTPEKVLEAIKAVKR